MKILLIALGIIIAVVVICWLAYFLVSLTVYIFQEINHEIRKTKQSWKYAWHDLQWHLKHR